MSDVAAVRYIGSTLLLSDEELGQLFGVSTSSLSQWLQHGVPEERQEAVRKIYDLTRLLAQKIRADRLPSVVRAKDERLHDDSMLELLTRDPLNGVEVIMVYLERLFSYLPET